MEDLLKIPEFLDRRLWKQEPDRPVKLPARKWKMPTAASVAREKRRVEKERRAARRAMEKDLALHHSADDAIDMAAALTRKETK